MKTVEIMYFPLVFSVLRWLCEEKLGSVRPSRQVCTSVTAYNMVYLKKLIVGHNHVVFSTLRCHEPTHNGMIVCYMVPNQTESAAKLCGTTQVISLRTSVIARSSICVVLNGN